MISNEPSPYDPIKYTDDPDWNLTNCCNDEEIIFLSLVFGYLLANFFLWNTALLKPMKLIAVFVHEMSHATACWITGGKVLGIEVFGNEGGVTKYQGGVVSTSCFLFEPNTSNFVNFSSTYFFRFFSNYRHTITTITKTTQKREDA